MANPSIGIHNLTGNIGADSYTSPSGYDSASTGSSFLVVVFCNGDTVSNPTDNFDNSYSAPTFNSGANPIYNSGGAGYLYVFLCTNGTGGTNHEVSVSASNVLQSVDFIEIQNASLTAPIDKSASVYVSSGGAISNAVTTSQAGDLVMGFGMTYADAPLSPGSGFTALDSYNSSPTYASCYLSDASEGSQNPDMTYTLTGQSAAGITVALQPASGGGSGAPPQPSPFAIGAALLGWMIRRRQTVPQTERSWCRAESGLIVPRKAA